MKLSINSLALSLSKINKTHLQFALMILTLVMLVLGAGAPEDVGGVGRQVILLTAIVAGTIIGWGYARWKGEAWQSPVFRATWLVALGFLPQLLAFYLPYTRKSFNDEAASWCLVLSQILLLIFAGLNIRLPGMSLLALGLTCNLIVILANGGFMPLTIDAASRLVSQTVLNRLVLGERVGSASKDILLADASMRLPWLADRFVPPQGVPYRFAFSLGDIFIALGTFWMLFSNKRTT